MTTKQGCAAVTKTPANVGIKQFQQCACSAAMYKY